MGCSTPPQYPLTEHGKPFAPAARDGTDGAPPVAQNVDSATIASARSQPQNWLTYYGSYDAQRYSPLAQVNTDNVAQLRPAWVFQAGVIGLIPRPANYALEAAPIVIEGVMFFSGWSGQVWALDAASGRELWRYEPAVPLDVPLCCGNVNRGVAVAQGKVFVATPNAHLVALDARSGEALWEQVFADVRAGESATAAPLIVKDKVVVGSSGGEYGVRGHLDAFDLATGALAWRRYTIPKPGEPGSDTWQKPGAWERGGGSTWITGSYDPQLDLLYWNTANPSPVYDGSARPGANLYTNSVLALEPDSGALRWHYQFTPHDVWDYDAIGENILFDLDGRKLLAHFNKNGYLFILDRENGALVRASPFGNVTWGDIDAQTGAVTVHRTPTPKGTMICPGPAGAKEWTHAAYSPQTRLLYVPTIDACGLYLTDPQEPQAFAESMPYWGSDARVAPADVKGGALQAIDPTNGRVVWRWPSKNAMVASVLATAGKLVFTGEPTGEFNAYDARSGKLLWQFQTGSGIHSNPITFSVDGRQYIAVASGWGGWMRGFAPGLLGGNRGGALFVFALPDRQDDAARSASPTGTRPALHDHH